MSRSVWVLCPDYGYEGLKEPFVAFETEEQARAELEVLNTAQTLCSIKLIEVVYHWAAEPKP